MPPPARSDSADPTDEDLGSMAQRERRTRILDSTLALASAGGYDAVQMRAVAERADVAIGTLYRYFPSKVHLLVSALSRELEKIDVRRAMPSGRTPQERMQLILGHITRVMQRDPLLTEAMTRAFMSADASAAPEVEQVFRSMHRFFARAMSDDEPTELQLSIARVISDVWLSNLVAWLTRRSSATDVAARLESTVDLLLGGAQAHERRSTSE